MSRIIVKNLPKNITEQDLRNHFDGPFEITDVNFKYSKDGKFRGFAFVGFKDEDAAAIAVESNNQTFIGRNRISAQVYDGNAVPIKQKLEGKKAKKKVDKNNEPRKEKKKKLDDPMERFADDPSFQEFLSVQKNVDVNDKSKYAWKDDAGMPIKGNEVVDSRVESHESEIGSKINAKKSKLPQEYPFTVKMRKIPYKVTKADVKTFFKPLSLARVKLQKLHGVAFFSFKSEKDVQLGLRKHRSILAGKQVDVILYKGNDSKTDALNVNVQKSTKKSYHEIKESVADTGRLYVRNLSYTCGPTDLENLFSSFGPLTEVYLPIDPQTKKPKGFAFVAFVFPEHAVRAMDELDKTVFQGRLLHILPGESKPESTSHLNHLSSYQEKREQEEKEKAKNPTAWNTLFLGINAAAEVMTNMYGVKKADLLADKTSKDSIAVRMALGETQIVNETKKFLIDNGIDLDSFEENSNSQIKQSRSKNVILVKNLPPKTDSTLIHTLFSRFGTVTRVILPPHGVTAIVEMQEEIEAKKAFDQLINYKVRHVPIYLEWAPVNIFISSTTADELHRKTNQTITITSSNQNVNDSTTKNDDWNENSNNIGYTLFVKNISFDTTDDSFQSHFSSCGKIVSAKISRQKKSGLSNGYGFVTFKTRKGAEKALRQLQNSVLDGHNLQVEKSAQSKNSRSSLFAVEKHPRTSGVSDSSSSPPAVDDKSVSDDANIRFDDTNNNYDESKKTNSAVSWSDSTTTKNKSSKVAKIVVRNVPFEASVKEVEQVFSSFGSLKSVRLPKKIVGSTTRHRGFAFVEYHTRSDAERAFESLRGSTHLYGRRLVLEWAKSDEEQEFNQDHDDDDNVAVRIGKRQKTSLGTGSKRLKKSDITSRLPDHTNDDN